MHPFLWLLWAILAALVAVGITGVAVAAYRSTKRLRAGHREFTLAMLKAADRGQPITPSQVYLEAKAQGVDRG